MIRRPLAAAFFSLLNIGTVYSILYLHKKALTRLYAASELFAQRIDHPDKKKQEESGRKQMAYHQGFFLV